MSEESSALAAALAAEHAAVYAYGVGGAHLVGADVDTARDWLDGHRDARDALAVRVRAAGAEPAGPLPGYALPFGVTGAGRARRLLAVVERRLGDHYGELVALDDAAARRRDARSLAGCAVRAATWSGRTEPFPGLLTPP